MYNSILSMTKSVWAMGRTRFPIWQMAAILDFKTQLVSLYGPEELLYQRGPLHHDLKSIVT